MIMLELVARMSKLFAALLIVFPT